MTPDEMSHCRIIQPIRSIRSIPSIYPMVLITASFFYCNNTHTLFSLAGIKDRASAHIHTYITLHTATPLNLQP